MHDQKGDPKIGSPMIHHDYKTHKKLLIDFEELGTVSVDAENVEEAILKAVEVMKNKKGIFRKYWSFIINGERWRIVMIRQASGQGNHPAAEKLPWTVLQ
jgi:hypothetical protein